MGGPIGMVGAAEWNHEGRDYWPVQFPYCDGKRQSPININNQDVKIETDVVSESSINSLNSSS